MNINFDVLGQLMPNPLTLVTQLLATFLLFVLMKKFAWEPAKKILAERAEYQQKLLTEAEDLKKENEGLRRQLEQSLEEADRKAQETIQQAQVEGEKLKNELVNEGKMRSKQLVEEAQQNAQQQKEKLLDEMHQEIVDVAMGAAEKMLSGKLDKKKDQQLIDSFIKEVANK